VAGLAAGRSFAQDKVETLAVKGGPKTVTFPSAELSALTRWPRYGDAEKKRLHELIDSHAFYQELPLFENEWKEYTRSPFVKAHMNGSSALTSMYFALDLPAGSATCGCLIGAWRMWPRRTGGPMRRKRIGVRPTTRWPA
jgi:hypothetical protein